MKVGRLEYRAWNGALRGSWLRAWPVCRTGLGLVLRRRIFWVFLFLGLMNFFVHFAMIYVTATRLRLMQENALPSFLGRLPRDILFDAEGRGYLEFLFGQSIVLMFMLGFAGAILVGNDFRFHSLAFYLSKPISRLHYFAGKLLSVFLLASFLTLWPTLALYIEYGAFTDWQGYFAGHADTFMAIIVSGCLTSFVSSAVLLGVSSLLERTIPTLVVWGAIFAFLPVVGNFLRKDVFRVDGNDPWRWGLFDLWSCLRWISRWFFDVRAERYEERLPWAIAVVGFWVGIACVVFWIRIKRTEVVR